MWHTFPHSSNTRHNLCYAFISRVCLDFHWISRRCTCSTFRLATMSTCVLTSCPLVSWCHLSCVLTSCHPMSLVGIYVCKCFKPFLHYFACIVQYLRFFWASGNFCIFLHVLLRFSSICMFYIVYCIVLHLLHNIASFYVFLSVFYMDLCACAEFSTVVHAFVSFCIVLPYLTCISCLRWSMSSVHLLIS